MAFEPDELAIIVNNANSALQSIQNEYQNVNVVAARVRFPRGFIRKAAVLRATLPNLGSEVQRRNASYSLMMLDVFRWVVIRTDLSRAALSITIKESISVLGAICEWLTKEATRGHGSSRKYKVRTARLVSMDIISDELKMELDWLWDVRCNEHIEGVPTLEHQMYERTDYNRALKAYRALRDILVLHAAPS